MSLLIAASGAVQVFASVADAVTVPGAGTVLVTGQAPTISNSGIVWILAAGQWDDSGDWDDGAVWSDSAGAALAPAAGTLALSGQAPAFPATHIAAPAQGTLAVTGLVPAVSASSLATTQLGTLALSGQAPAFPTAGSVFFVDPAGDDGNNGMSEGTAWATIARVNSESLLAGDTVRFKRGSVFRGAGIDPNVGGVTYEAYGAGAKPIITGSPDLSSPGIWTHFGNGTWTTPLAEHGAEPPEIMWFDDVRRAEETVAELQDPITSALVAPEWAWSTASGGILYVFTNSTTLSPPQVYSDIQINQLRYGFDGNNSLGGFVIRDIVFRNFRQGIYSGGDDYELYRVEMYRSSRNNFQNTGANAHLEDCISNDCGLSGVQGCHGYLWTLGATNWTMLNCSANDTREDNVQVGNTAGNGGLIDGGTFTAPGENCLDRKTGTGLIVRNVTMTGGSNDFPTFSIANIDGGVSGTTTIEDSVITSTVSNNALSVLENNTLISRRNTYVANTSGASCVRVNSLPTGNGFFDSEDDIIWQKGSSAAFSADSGMQIDMDHCTVVSLSGRAVDLDFDLRAGADIRFEPRNCIFWSASGNFVMDLLSNGNYSSMDWCLLFRNQALSSNWINYGVDTGFSEANWGVWTGTQLTNGTYQAARAGLDNVVVADPLFTDRVNGDFSLQAGSPARNAGSDGEDLGVRGLSSIVAFHVSGTGNDSNDGLTPATAWRSVSKVNSAQLEPGDTVLFERGSVFRGAGLAPSVVDLTFGAYGTGDKPVISGSPDLSNTAIWTHFGNGTWTTPLAQAGGEDPEIMWFDDVRRAEDPLASLQDPITAGLVPPEWSWSVASGGLLYVFTGSTTLSPPEVYDDIEINHLRYGFDGNNALSGFVISDIVFRNFRQPVYAGGDNYELYRVEMYRGSRNNFQAGGDGTYLEECVSNDNGLSSQQGVMGYHFTLGATNCTMKDCTADDNREDNIQFGPTCGDNITVDGGTFTNPGENCVDRKSGTGHVLRNATFQNNQSGHQTVNLHVDPAGGVGTTTIEDCFIEQLASHGALQCVENLTLISRRNTYVTRGANSENCWRLGALSTGNTVVDSGLDVVWCENEGNAITLDSGCQVDMDHCTVVSEGGRAVDCDQDLRAGADLRFEPRNSIFWSASGNFVMELMSNGDFSAMDWNLLFRNQALSNNWIGHVVDTGFSEADWGTWTGTHLADGTYQAARAGLDNVVVANPLFTDRVNGDFSLQGGSPALNAAEDGSDLGAIQS